MSRLRTGVTRGLIRVAIQLVGTIQTWYKISLIPHEGSSKKKLHSVHFGSLCPDWPAEWTARCHGGHFLEVQVYTRTHKKIQIKKNHVEILISNFGLGIFSAFT